MTSGLTNERRTVGLFAGYAALVTLGSLLASDRTLAFFAKEGPSEHLSHAVLLGAVLAWSMFGARERRPRRSWPTFAMAAFLAVVLLEETDWGAVYGVQELSAVVRTWFPKGNLHNAASGASYMLFAVPLLGYFLLPLSSGRLGRACVDAFGASVPGASERWVFVLVAFLPPPLTLVLSTRWERALDEMIELPLYGLMLSIAVRALRTSSPTR